MDRIKTGGLCYGINPGMTIVGAFMTSSRAARPRAFRQEFRRGEKS